MITRTRLAGGAMAALATLLALATAQFIAVAPAAQAVETQLTETGWVASANTNSTGADVPANAIDGNLATRYSSDAYQASGMYFQVNLGSSQTFNQIEMNAPNSAGDYAVGYNVEVSTNGSTFTTVYSGTNSVTPEIATFTAQTAQYIRVVLTAASTTNWWSIDEFTVYNGTPETELSQSGWTASANTDSTGADVPANAIDGNLATRYSSDAVQASGMYFQVNLGSSQTFNEIEMNSVNSAS